MHFVPPGDSWRAPIDGPKRLATFLSYIAFGAPYRMLAKNYGIGLGTVKEIIHDVANAVL